MSSIVLYLTKRGILKAVIIAFSFIMIYDSVDLRSFRPISALCSKNNPRNIKYMPAVIFLHALSACNAQAGLILNENPHKSTESFMNASNSVCLEIDASFCSLKINTEGATNE